MYYYVNGILDHVDSNFAVIDCAGVGYKLFITSHTARKIIIGQKTKLYTYLNIREDAQDLFGFIDNNELSSFKLLIGINGVGPKAALAILSELDSSQFAVAIVTGDTKSLTRAPGVGTKLASRIILELKDKLKCEDITEGIYTQQDSMPLAPFGNLFEAASALVVLGFSKTEAEQAVKKTGCLDSNQVEDIIKKALSNR